MKSNLIATFSLLVLCVTTGFAQTVLQDNFDWPGTNPGDLNGDINANIPARQSGTTNTNYTASIVNPVAGVLVALEYEAPALSGSPDVLFLRTQTDPGSTGTTHQIKASLDTNFTSLASNAWTFDYTARLTVGGAALGDVFFALAMGTNTAPDAPATSDAFYFAVRDTGAWLLWRNGAADFTSGSLTGWTNQQEYSVALLVDESIGNPTLSIEVTPLGESAQNIASGLSLNSFGSNREFAFVSSAVSQSNGAITDSRATGLDITIIPESSTAGFCVVALGLIIARLRKSRISCIA